MAEKIEGYKKRDESYETLKPKDLKVEIKQKDQMEGSSMSQFRKSMEDHMGEISAGRGNGIPDNYKKKDK